MGAIRAVTDLCEQYGVRMHYSFVGVALQQQAIMAVQGIFARGRWPIRRTCGG